MYLIPLGETGLQPEPPGFGKRVYWPGEQPIHFRGRPKMGAMICSILLLAAVGWVLRVNAKDRRNFEKELDDACADDPD